jgi:prepilin-type processing-associated H-X9-DG protein
VAANRHNDGANSVFLDGHAGFLKARAIVTDRWREVRSATSSVR